MKTGIVIQARMGSTRLPSKVMADIHGKPALWHVWRRASQIKRVDVVIIATTWLQPDREILWWARSLGIPCYTGSPTDLLDRYYNASVLYHLDNIVRITGDCPCLDPEVSQLVVDAYVDDEDHDHLDYVSNVDPPTFPDGLDTEIFSFDILEKAWYDARVPSEREHIRPWMLNPANKVRKANVVIPTLPDLSAHRWTLDTSDDLMFIRALYGQLGDNFSMQDALALSPTYPVARL